MEPELLKELQALQVLYKTNFDLVSQKVDNQAQKVEQLAQKLQDAVSEIEQARQQMDEVATLMEDVIAEKDVQIQKLIKAVAALTVVTDQLTTRFAVQQ